MCSQAQGGSRSNFTCAQLSAVTLLSVTPGVPSGVLVPVCPHAALPPHSGRKEIHGALTLLLSILVPLLFARKRLCLNSKSFIFEEKIPIRLFLPQGAEQEIVRDRQPRRGKTKLEKHPKCTPCPVLVAAAAAHLVS